MFSKSTPIIMFLLCLCLAPASTTWAFRHLMVIDELGVGLGGNPNVQFIELRTTAPGQNLTQGGRIVARNADGSVEQTVFTFPSNFGSGGSGDIILIATPNFEDLAGIAPDFTFAGGLSPGAGQVILFPGETSDALAYGNYTGPSATGSVGLAPALSGDDTLTLQRTGNSGNDAQDYALLENAPENFAGQMGHLVIPAAQPEFALAVDLETIAMDLAAPVGMAVPNDGSGRLFIHEQTGKILIIDTTNNNNLLATPFLDLSAKLAALGSNPGERGLLGLAFHPNYSNNGAFYVLYSAPNNSATRTTISEFLAQGDPATSNVADPTSERILLTIDKPAANHNGGQLAFGPDGFLYIGIGDGGGANDQGPGHNPTIGNGQDPDTLQGKVLRVDVDSMLIPYGIPLTNPFSMGGGAPEIFALGLRNPYRFGFDDVGAGKTGWLILPDVGQNLIEEVNFVKAPGLNLGWRIKEGSQCFDPDNPTVPPASCDETGLTDPVAEYFHPGGGGPVEGVSVIGGYVYRGSMQEVMQGVYLFGDFALDRNDGTSGQLFAMAFDTAFPADPPIPISQVLIDENNTTIGGVLNSIGRDEDGELYVLGQVGTGFPDPPTGFVKKIVNARVVENRAMNWMVFE